MFPNFTLLGKEISYYSLMAIVGLLAAGVVLYFLASRRRVSRDELLHTALAAGGGALIGSHLLYALTNVPLLLSLLSSPEGIIESERDYFLLVLVILGGSVFYGGLLGGFAGGYGYARHRRLEVREYTDLFAVGIPLFHVFGRIGCFLGGCCYGVEWESGITYHYSLIESANGVSRFPVQLAEAGANAIIFLVLLGFFLKNRQRGQLIYLYLLCYAPVRFLLEFLRGDRYRGIWFGLSTSQWISILLLAAALFLLLKSHRKREMPDKE